MIYSFDSALAKKYGVNEAIMIQNFQFWIAKNKANGKHEHEGRTWTYNSARAFTELFEFWTEKQIYRILDSLVECGVLVTGNFNQIGYDRTRWFAFSDESIFLNGSFHFTKRGNGFPEKGEPVPDIIPDNKPNIIPDIPKAKRTATPTLDEVKEECKSKGYLVDPIAFFTYYDSHQWVDANGNRVKSWKHKLITWNNKEKEKSSSRPIPEREESKPPKKSLQRLWEDYIQIQAELRDEGLEFDEESIRCQFEGEEAELEARRAFVAMRENWLDNGTSQG